MIKSGSPTALHDPVAFSLLLLGAGLLGRRAHAAACAFFLFFFFNGAEQDYSHHAAR